MVEELSMEAVRVAGAMLVETITPASSRSSIARHICMTCRPGGARQRLSAPRCRKLKRGVAARRDSNSRTALRIGENRPTPAGGWRKRHLCEGVARALRGREPVVEVDRLAAARGPQRLHIIVGRLHRERHAFNDSDQKCHTSTLQGRREGGNLEQHTLPQRRRVDAALEGRFVRSLGDRKAGPGRPEVGDRHLLAARLEGHARPLVAGKASTDAVRARSISRICPTRFTGKSMRGGAAAWDNLRRRDQRSGDEVHGDGRAHVCLAVHVDVASARPDVTYRYVIFPSISRMHRPARMRCPVSLR